MREETTIRVVRACKAAGRRDLVSALRNGALTAAEVHRRLAQLRSGRIAESGGPKKSSLLIGTEIQEGEN